MPPSLQGHKKKSAFVPSVRDKGASFLCGTTLVPEKWISGTRFAVSGGPGVSYLVSDRCSEGIPGPVTLLPCTKRQLSGMWGRTDLSSS